MISDNMIYLDHAATTPIDAEVLNAMLPYFKDDFGNPSSIHLYGQKAEAAIDSSREIIAQLLNCHTNEIIFTSGGTESNNLAIRGVALAAKKHRKANHILISPVEHPAITNTAKQLAYLYDYEIEFLPVDQYGVVDPKNVASRLRSDTAIVSVIYANNEVGSINPISEIGAICQERGVPFHTDAVQATAFLPIDVQSLNIDFHRQFHMF